MPYTVTELITKAYYLSQVVSRELETVSGPQLDDALVWLNALLSFKSVNSNLIPYYTSYNFNAVANQEMYFVPNLINPESMTFQYQAVRYSMQPLSRRAYQGGGRTNGISSLPFNWHAERCVGGSNVFMYFLPSTDYPITIWGRFGFDAVELNQDLALTFDQYYLDYMRFKLANRICSEYGIPFQPQSAMELDNMEQSLITVSPPDLTTIKYSSFGRGSGSTWAQVNLGRGFTTS